MNILIDFSFSLFSYFQCILMIVSGGRWKPKMKMEKKAFDNLQKDEFLKETNLNQNIFKQNFFVLEFIIIGIPREKKINHDNLL